MTDLEKLRSIRQGGKTKGKVQVRRLSEAGRTRGFEVEYQDGRTEAIVRPSTVKQRFSVSRREVDE